MANKDLNEQKIDNETSKKIVAQLTTDTTKKVTTSVGSSGPSSSKKMKPDEFIEIDSLVNEVGDLLKLVRHPNNSVTIKAAKILLESLSSEKPLSTTTQTTTSQQPMKSSDILDGDCEIRIQQSKFNLDDITLPSAIMSNWKNKMAKNETTPLNDCDNNDIKRLTDKKLTEAFERASKALRLLYLNDQKQLQLKVNETISSIQSITANPKTDSKLVSIGR